MNFTPLDIRKAEFRKQFFRGYNRREVRLFLETVAEDMAGLIQENERLKERVAQLEKELGQYRGMEEEIRETLKAAQRTARQIVEEAKDKAREYLMEVKQERARLEEEVELARKAKTEILRELRTKLARLLAEIGEEEEAELEREAAGDRRVSEGEAPPRER